MTIDNTKEVIKILRDAKKQIDILIADLQKDSVKDSYAIDFAVDNIRDTLCEIGDLAEAS